MPASIDALSLPLRCSAAQEALGRLLAAAIVILLVVGASSAAESKVRPNVVLILADDLGYGDLACYGHPVIATPNIDRLARQGLRLTNCYAAGANCSPSRAGLMTGRTPYRAGVQNQIPMLSPMHLPASERTIATLLRETGYATCHSGKWHLNGMFNLPGQPQPSDHGFDHWLSTQNNCLPNHHRPYDFVRNLIPMGPIEGYAGEIVADEACRWLRERGRDQPFFLFVCFHEPHEPIRTDPKFSARYPYPDDPSRAAYYGNVTQLDDAVGRVLKTLDEIGAAENTLVWFTSDNGPARTRWHNAGSAGPLRGSKGDVYEGGIRVPGIVRWPGHVRPDRISDVPICGTDFLPTVCDIVGLAPPGDRTLDGMSVRGLLEGGTIDRAKPLYWQFNHALTPPALALRQGTWKVVARLTERPKAGSQITEESNRALKHAQPTAFELYDLAHDPAEAHDLAAREPAKLRELSAALTERFQDVQRETPVWPLFVDPRYEQLRIEWPDYVAKPRK